MDTLLTRTSAEERYELFVATAARMGISARLVEKDFWVCWMLRRLFTLPGIGEHLTFKGGTSLSKAYQLISRFSEDIDLIVERSWLGVPDSPTGSHKQWLNKVKKGCRDKVNADLLPQLRSAVSKALAEDSERLRAPQTGDEDPRVVTFQYPTALTTEVEQYFPSEVKMEFTARSEAEPVNTETLTPYAAFYFPDAVPDSEIVVRCLSPERTLFEKMTLLHEEICRPVDGVRPRLSRHFYDIAQIVASEVANRALGNIALFESVIDHRAAFFGYEWMGDYSTMRKGPIILRPPPDRIAAWERDYELTKPMFFAEPPSFDDLLEAVNTFAAKLNKLRGFSAPKPSR